MKALDFPQRNLMLAEDQPQYETLPVFCEVRVMKNDKGMQSDQIPWAMTACFELSDAEIEQIVKTKKLWYKQMLFGGAFQPMLIMAEDPFKPVIGPVMKKVD